VLIFCFSSRYRLPAVPFLVAFAGCGLVELLARLRASPAAGLRFALPGILAAALSFQTISPARREFEGAQFFNFGAALTHGKKHAPAAVNLERALRGLDDNWQVHHYLAFSYLELDDIE
jgi:hypothetical protein